jgi:hypothetical protein
VQLPVILALAFKIGDYRSKFDKKMGIGRLIARFGYFMEEKIVKSCIRNEIDGIKICDVGEDYHEFVTIISDSINLIRSLDPKRYSILTSEISWITKSYLPSEGWERGRARIIRCKY